MSRPYRRSILKLEQLEHRITPVSISVTTNADAGDGSLRAAIVAVNASNDQSNEITFNITGNRTIQLLSNLDKILRQVTIDGTSQNGWEQGRVAITTSTPLVTAGLVVEKIGSGSVIKGLSIFGMTDAIQIIGSDIGSHVQGCWLGIDPSGAAVRTPNGIHILDESKNNTIGGVSSLTRNVIVGADNGILIENSFDNVITGNYIGTSVDGKRLLSTTTSGTPTGCNIVDSRGNRIGGPGTGQGNVIAAKGGVGVFIQSTNNLFTITSTKNTLQGNYIGVNAEGDAFLSDSGAIEQGNFDGVKILDAADNRVGGKRDSGGNLISNNFHSGVYVKRIGLLQSKVTDYNVIEGNVIGLLPASDGIAGSRNGVLLEKAYKTRIGGDTDEEYGNIISANGYGIRIDQGTLATNVFGNLIGTDLTGDGGGYGNTDDGIFVTGNSGFTEIGNDLRALSRNVISGNSRHGIQVDRCGLISIMNNFVGVDRSTGSFAVKNGSSGIYARDVSGLAIGTSTPQFGNVISGNDSHGVELQDFITEVEVLGNHIGVTKDGDAKVSNKYDGIRVLNCKVLTIGGANDPENGKLPGNVISGNKASGIRIFGAPDESYLYVFGNKIGTDKTGNLDLGNGQVGIGTLGTIKSGVYLGDPSFGGTKGTGPGNIVGFNLINVSDSTEAKIIATGNVIKEAKKGAGLPGPTGVGALIDGSNGSTFVWNDFYLNSENAILSTNGASNISLIDNNVFTSGADGIKVENGSSEILIMNNSIRHNMGHGIAVEGSTNIRIGGPTVPEGPQANIILANAFDGIAISGSSDILVEYNTIGEPGYENGGNGVFIADNSSDVSLFANAISFNELHGIRVEDSTIIYIGDDAPYSGNVITENKLDGVSVVGESSSVGILGNSIYSNGGLGIDLDDDDVTPNDYGLPGDHDQDTGPNLLQNFPELTWTGSGFIVELWSTPDTDFHFEFFANALPDESGHGEGEIFIGYADWFTDSDGYAAFPMQTVYYGYWISATATDPFGNTSEFSFAVEMPAMFGGGGGMMIALGGGGDGDSDDSSDGGTSGVSQSRDLIEQTARNDSSRFVLYDSFHPSLSIGPPSDDSAIDAFDTWQARTSSSSILEEFLFSQV